MALTNSIREIEDKRRNEDIRKMEEERRRISQQQEMMRHRQLEDLRKQKQLEEQKLQQRQLEDQKRIRQLEEQKKLSQLQLYNNRQPLQRNSYEEKRRIEESKQSDIQRKRAFEDAKMEAFRNKQRLALEEPPRQSVPQRPPSSDRVSQNKRRDDEDRLAEARKQQYWEMRQQAERNKKRIEEQLYGFPTNGENGTKQPDESSREKDSETKWEQNKHRPPANAAKAPIKPDTEL